MSGVNTILSSDIKMLRHYIKDLSFENLSETVENFQQNNPKILHNIDFNYKNYKSENSNYKFSVSINYNCNLVSTTQNNNFLILELVYFGLFEVELKSKLDQDMLTKNALEKLYPYVKSIVEYITQRGSSIKVTLDDLNFDLLKKTNS